MLHHATVPRQTQKDSARKGLTSNRWRSSISDNVLRVDRHFLHESPPHFYSMNPACFTLVCRACDTVPSYDKTFRGRGHASLGSRSREHSDQARRIDLNHHTVIPGLVGMHEHLFYPSGGGIPMYIEHAMSFPRLYLASGVTVATDTSHARRSARS